MRFHELLNERAHTISDDERIKLIEFLVKWLQGSYMHTDLSGYVEMWERIGELFPARVTKPMRLFRLVTLPVRYADEKVFHLDRPAPKAMGSWTSTHFGLESVHAIAGENYPPNTCRIAIQATIAPENVVATHQSLRRAFLSLTRDYDWANAETSAFEKQPDGTMLHKTSYKPYLGNTDPALHGELDYYISIFKDIKGGPLRQYEHIVRTTPLTVKNIRVYRREEEWLHDGHDDPHNSGDYRGWHTS